MENQALIKSFKYAFNAVLAQTPGFAMLRIRCGFVATLFAVNVVHH